MARLDGSPAALLLGRLERVRENSPGQWLALCPAHADRNPSLSVRELDDGQILLHCFAGCPAADVMAAVGLDLADLFPNGGADSRPVARGRRWDWRGLLLALNREVHVVVAVAQDLQAGRSLPDADRERLQLAAARIARVAEVAR
jgi:hypothetical protein